MPTNGRVGYRTFFPPENPERLFTFRGTGRVLILDVLIARRPFVRQIFEKYSRRPLIVLFKTRMTFPPLFLRA